MSWADDEDEQLPTPPPRLVEKEAKEEARMTHLVLVDGVMSTNPAHAPVIDEDSSFERISHLTPVDAFCPHISHVHHRELPWHSQRARRPTTRRREPDRLDRRPHALTPSSSPGFTPEDVHHGRRRRYEKHHGGLTPMIPCPKCGALDKRILEVDDDHITTIRTVFEAITAKIERGEALELEILMVTEEDRQITRAGRYCIECIGKSSPICKKCCKHPKAILPTTCRDSFSLHCSPCMIAYKASLEKKVE